MDFYTANGLKRPVRLNETTRRFAYESLNHKYGIDTRKNDCVVLDNVENIENMTALERYDAAIAINCIRSADTYLRGRAHKRRGNARSRNKARGARKNKRKLYLRKHKSFDC